MEEDLEAPPEDANDWSDEQWIDWLKATDIEVSGGDQPTPVMKRAAHTAGGQVLGNAMIGLAQALYGRQDEKPAIVIESDEPEGDQPLELHLDFDNPDRSFVIVKPDADASG